LKEYEIERNTRIDSFVIKIETRQLGMNMCIYLILMEVYNINKKFRFSQQEQKHTSKSVSILSG